MTWSRFDDGYDEHPKIEAGWFAHPPNPVGLHAMATTCCNRRLTDGVVPPRWLDAMLNGPWSERREAVLETMVRVELFDLLAAGETLAVTDSSGNELRLGPFMEDRYVVHDFLDRHDSSVQVKARRAADAARKRRRTIDFQPDSSRIPGGLRAESTATPDGLPSDSGRLARARERGRAPASRPDPTRPIQTPQPPRPAAVGEPDTMTAGRRGNGSMRAGGRNPRALGTNPRAAAVGAVLELAAREFPAAHPHKVLALAEHLRGRQVEPTPDAMRDYAAAHPAWTLDGGGEAA